MLEGSDADVREQAIPFRAGDEVLVTIVEPHMYEVDDAVAKIDGYIISVTGGGAHVGEKRLVRIEEAGRTAATAVLVERPARCRAKRRKAAAKSAAKPPPRRRREAGAQEARPHDPAEAGAQGRGEGRGGARGARRARRLRTAMT